MRIWLCFVAAKAFGQLRFFSAIAPSRKVTHPLKAYASYILAIPSLYLVRRPDAKTISLVVCAACGMSLLSSFHAGARSDQADINDDVTYTVDTITLYKSESNVKYAQEISFNSAGNGAACGLFLTTGEEYLIHLDSYDGKLWGNSCGGTKTWGSVSESEVETLQDGCNDLCEEKCGEFQVWTGYEVVVSVDVVVAVR